MVRKIMRDPLFLAQKSIDATEADKQVVTDLLDTLKANGGIKYVRSRKKSDLIFLSKG